MERIGWRFAAVGVTLLCCMLVGSMLAAWRVEGAAAASLLGSLAWPELQLEVVAEGLDQPVFVADPGDGSGRLFIVEKGGVIKIAQKGQGAATPSLIFLDISDRVANEGEAGLLSVAFPPDFATSKYFLVHYNSKDKNLVPSTEEGVRNDGYDTVVARFRVGGDPNKADAGSEERLLLVNQPYPNHNGGLILFGPDGKLYIGLGDGGSGGDPHNFGQRLDTLLGKILRVEVGKTGAYTIPADNPFTARSDVRGEIWTYGLRNPWRFSFDRATGDLWVGDVGQNLYEEVDFVPFAAAGGSNFGWKIWEGTHCYNTTSCPSPTGYVPPVLDYSHADGCSVTGGYVARGPYPRLAGVYVYADFCSKRVWGLQKDAGGVWQNQLLLTHAGDAVASFGEDAAGDLYLVDFGGTIYRIVDVAARWPFNLYLPLVARP